jgi:hypothetical protein
MGRFYHEFDVKQCGHKLSPMTPPFVKLVAPQKKKSVYLRPHDRSENLRPLLEVNTLAKFVRLGFDVSVLFS